MAGGAGVAGIGVGSRTREILVLYGVSEYKSPPLSPKLLEWAIGHGYNEIGLSVKDTDSAFMAHLRVWLLNLKSDADSYQRQSENGNTSVSDQARAADDATRTCKLIDAVQEDLTFLAKGGRLTWARTIAYIGRFKCLWMIPELCHWWCQSSTTPGSLLFQLEAELRSQPFDPDEVDFEFYELNPHRPEFSIPKAALPAIRAGREKCKIRKSGWVYLVECNGHYKIGVSSQLQVRVEALSKQSPFPYKLIKALFYRDVRSAESKWHARFADQRRRGEWFELSPENVEEFRVAQGDLDV